MTVGLPEPALQPTEGPVCIIAVGRGGERVLWKERRDLRPRWKEGWRLLMLRRKLVFRSSGSCYCDVSKTGNSCSIISSNNCGIVSDNSCSLISSNSCSIISSNICSIISSNICSIVSSNSYSIVSSNICSVVSSNSW